MSAPSAEDWTCPVCGHTLAQHCEGETLHQTCDCCQWRGPWESSVITPVNYDTNPLYDKE
jgi:hypothetical protein